MSDSVPTEPPKPLILIVDDEPKIIRLLQLELQFEGFEVRACGSAEEAIREVAKRTPDLALIDMRLPAMSGPELAATLRGDASFPILLVTAMDGRAAEEAASGMDGYILKPFDTEELIGRIRELLGAFAS